MSKAKLAVKFDRKEPYPEQVFAIFDGCSQDPFKVIHEEGVAKAVLDLCMWGAAHREYSMAKYVLADGEL
jgi:hypothetical protein